MASSPATGRPLTGLPGATESAEEPGRFDAAAAARLPIPDVLSRLGSHEDGLSGAEAALRLRSVGRNALAVRRVSAVAVFLRQLRNPLLLLLLAAAGVSGLTGDPTDAVIIARDRRAQRRARASSTSTAPRTPSPRCTATSATTALVVARRRAGRDRRHRRSCRATSSRCASATSCPPTCGCSRRRSSSATRRC